MIILTGGELLRGVYADGHTLFLTRTLGPLGCRCYGTMCVGDEAKALCEALGYAAQRVDLILVTGGLGPTRDDITRKALSQYTGIELKQSPEVLRYLTKRFQVKRKEELRSNVLRQAYVPSQGAYLPNANGTAVGLVFEKDSGETVVALPGPPDEMQPMVRDHLIPYLAEHFGIYEVGASLTMRFVGIGESPMDSVIERNLQLPEDLIVSSIFKNGRVDLTFAFPENTPEAKKRLKRLENQLLEHIGQYMYSDRALTLEERVCELFGKHRKNLIIAEAASGGALAASLSQAERAREVFEGGYIAPTVKGLCARIPNSEKFQGKTLPEQTEELAKQLGRREGGCLSTVISEIVKGAEGASHVWIAAGDSESGFVLKQVGVRGKGQQIQKQLVNRGLDLLRKKLDPSISCR